jgi:hypothetical protein
MDRKGETLLRKMREMNKNLYGDYEIKGLEELEELED